MKPHSIVLSAAGLGLLALAGWMATFPRPRPHPGLTEIAPFEPGERLVLVLDAPETFPPAETLGLVQRARQAGADVRVMAPGELMEPPAEPTRAFQPAPWPESPSGYHPDQWPVVRPEDDPSRSPWQMLTLKPQEIAVKNAAVLEAARTIRESGTDDARGTRELHVLSRARRAEIYLPLGVSP